MFCIDNFFVFLGTGILLNLYPGQDSLYVIGRSISQGRAAGVCAVLGISTGSLFHTVVGATGLSAILLASAEIFSIIKYAGALYLFFQAIQMFRQSLQPASSRDMHTKHAGLLKIYRQGAITNILNPKVALFFLALLPQFISPSSPNPFISFMVLGVVFITTGTLWCLILAFFSSFFSQKIRNNSAISKWMLRVNAGLFTYLGISLATAHLKAQNG